MAGEVGRFRGMQHSDMRKLIRDYEKRIKGYQHEQEMIGWRNISSEAWQAEDRNIEGDRAVIREIEAEIERQRLVRVRREDESSGRDRAKASTNTSLGSALSAWHETMSVELPEFISISWTVNGRQYSGRFYYDSGKLDVSLAVPANTPGSRQRGNRYFLPCNTRGQHQAAIQAQVFKK